MTSFMLSIFADDGFPEKLFICHCNAVNFITV